MAVLPRAPSRRLRSAWLVRDPAVDVAIHVSDFWILGFVHDSSVAVSTRLSAGRVARPVSAYSMRCRGHPSAIAHRNVGHDSGRQPTLAVVDQLADVPVGVRCARKHGASSSVPGPVRESTTGALLQLVRPWRQLLRRPYSSELSRVKSLPSETEASPRTSGACPRLRTGRPPGPMHPSGRAHTSSLATWVYAAAWPSPANSKPPMGRTAGRTREHGIARRECLMRVSIARVLSAVGGPALRGPPQPARVAASSIVKKLGLRTLQDALVCHRLAELRREARVPTQSAYAGFQRCRTSSMVVLRSA